MNEGMNEWMNGWTNDLQHRSSCWEKTMEVRCENSPTPTTQIMSTLVSQLKPFLLLFLLSQLYPPPPFSTFSSCLHFFSSAVFGKRNDKLTSYYKFLWAQLSLTHAAAIARAICGRQIIWHLHTRGLLSKLASSKVSKANNFVEVLVEGNHKEINFSFVL